MSPVAVLLLWCKNSRKKAGYLVYTHVLLYSSAHRSQLSNALLTILYGYPLSSVFIFPYLVI